jgi:cytochrome c biogenesis protein CcmG, thiol:disulfide interchange protein DsbE
VPSSSSPPSGPRQGWDRRRTIGAVAAGVAVAALVALLAIGLLNKGVETSIARALDAGERPPAPDLELPVLVAGDGVGPAGGTFSLEALRGRTVVVNVWASWCIPCKTEAPILDAIARRYRERGAPVLVLGIDVKDLSEKALAFWERYDLSYPSLRDRDGDVDEALQTTGVPETFVIDPQGRIAYRKIGEIRSEDQITPVLDDLAPA